MVLFYWSATWRQPFIFYLDRPVIDLSWKVAHGVLYTAKRLSYFGCLAFVLFPVNLFGICFFDCPLAVSVLSWLQSLLFYSWPLSPTILVHHVSSGFSSGVLRVVPRVFVYHVNICKFCIGWAQNDYRFCRVPPSVLIVMDRVN